MEAPNTSERLSQYVNENIDSIASFHKREQEKLSPAERLLDSVTGLIGRPLYLVALLSVVVLWISLNTLASSLGLRALDPTPYALLEGALTFAALATTTIVLITQQRLERLERQRAHLDLQVNLLTEQKVTKVIHLLEELRRDLPMVPDRHDVAAAELQQRTDTAQVLSALEEVGISSRPGPDSAAADTGR